VPPVARNWRALATSKDTEGQARKVAGQPGRDEVADRCVDRASANLGNPCRTHIYRRGGSSALACQRIPLAEPRAGAKRPAEQRAALARGGSRPRPAPRPYP
jgi:hypothetical protein